MEKSIKCLLLEVDTVIVSELSYIDIDPDDISGANIKLIKPYQLTGDTNDMNSRPHITNQTEILISSESILTIVDPKPEIAKKYLELVSE